MAQKFENISKSKIAIEIYIFIFLYDKYINSIESIDIVIDKRILI